MGIDVARGGADQSAVWLRQGLLARRLYKRHTPDSMVFAERLASLLREHEPDAAFIDMGAMGAPVYDRLVIWARRLVLASILFPFRDVYLFL